MFHFKKLIKFDSSKIFFLILISLVLLIGYSFARHDQAIYIPLLKKILDPTLFTRDGFQIYIQSESANFWRITSIFFRIFGIEIGFFMLYYVGLLILISTSYLIGKDIFKNTNAALLFSLLVLASRIPFSLQETFFSPRSLDIPLFLFGAYLFIKGRYYLSYLFIGLLINIHQLFGIMIFSLIFGVNILFIRKIGVRRTFICLVIFILSIIPTFIILLSRHDSGTFFVIDNAWYNLQRVILPGVYSIFYSEGTIYTWTFIINIVSSLSICFILLRLRKYIDSDKKFNFDKLNLLILFSTLFLIFAAIIYRIYPTIFLGELQLIRESEFSVIFTALGAAAVLYLLYSKRFISKAELLILFIFNYFNLFLITGLWTLLSVKFKKVMKYIALFFVPVCIGMLILTFLVTRGISVISLPSNIYNPTIYAQDQNDINLQKWMKDNTSVNSLFLAPPYINDVTQGNLRIFSERNIFLTSSEIWMSSIDQNAYKYVMERLNDLTKERINEPIKNIDSNGFFKIIQESYDNLSIEDLSYLKVKYNIDYFIVENKYEYNFQKVYQNEEFKVYKL